MRGMKGEVKPGGRALDWFNALPAHEAEAALLACCGSAAWAGGLAARRPFADAASLAAAAESLWWALGPAGWREAFAAHPRIGETEGGHSADCLDGRQSIAGVGLDGRRSIAGTCPDGRRSITGLCLDGRRSIAGLWSEAEQAGARGASARLRDELAAANRTYESHFGHIFLICATGKSGEEMLAALRARLGNDPETELRVAAGEQAKITRLRLARLLA